MSTAEQLIVGSMIVLPFTLLRFGIMGLGEVFFILLFIYTLIRPIVADWLSSFHFSRFWVAYLLVSFIGFLYNVIFLDHATGTVEGMVFDCGAFMMVLMACFSLENLIKRGKINTYAILRNIFFTSSIVMVALYVASLFTDSILGLSLKYHHYFVPLANNLHQISMFLVPLPFIGLKIFAIEKKRWIKLLVVFLILMDAYMAFSTGSTKAYLSIFLGIFSFLILHIYLTFSKELRIVLFMLVVILSGTGIIIFIGGIKDYLIEYFTTNDLGGGRQMLYNEAINIAKKSPIFGLGTGAHIWTEDKFSDAHQSFLAAFLHAGLIGVVLLVNLFYKLLRRNFNDPALFAAIIAILLYALGGDILRRLPIWVFMVLLFYYNKRDEYYFKQSNKIRLLAALKALSSK